MAIPTLPVSGSTDWYAHYTALDGAARVSPDPATNRPPTAVRQQLAADLGDLTQPEGAAVGAAFVPWSGSRVYVTNPKYNFVAGADNTATIEAAWADCAQSGKCLWFPAGTYIYNGSGLSGINPNIHGAGREKTKITLGASSRLFDISGSLGSADIGGFSTTGGLGLFRSTNTGSAVGGLYRFTDMQLSGYTSAAIENNASDMPYWKLRDIIFQGGNRTTTIGIALSGLSDGCSFENIEFLDNRVALKIRNGANNAYVRNCDFIRFGAAQGYPRVDVWVVPRAQMTNSGAGFVIESCKFGAENLDPSDKRILYADEDTSGTTNGTQFPVLSADSTGYISSHTVKNVMLAGVTGAAIPLVYSTTPNVQSGNYGSIILDGSIPSLLVQFRSVPPVNRLTTDNIIGPIYGSGLAVDGDPAPAPTNAVGFAAILDPQGMMAGAPGIPHQHTAQDTGGYASLARTPTAVYNASGDVTVASATDSYGGTDARVATFGGTGVGKVQIVLAAASIVAGRPVWMEFDAQAGSLVDLRVTIEQSGGALHYSRAVQLNAGWTRYRLLWTPRITGVSQNLMLKPLSTVSGTFTVGRIRVYHAYEPLNTDGLTVIDGTLYKLTVSSGSITATAV